MQFFAVPLLAELSDCYGRRPVILASVFGLGCDYVLLTFAPNLWWLFAGRLIAGRRFAEAAVPSCMGPALGGLLGTYGLRLPFIAAAVLCFGNGCFGLFVLPESLPPCRSFDASRLNPFRQLLSAMPD